MSTKKEFLQMLLKKYNKKDIKVIEKFDNFPGAISNNEIKIVFDLDVVNKDTLLIQDVINKDNISLYYEFMSDKDLNELSDLFLRSLLLERQCLVVKDEEIFPTLKNSWWENVTIKSIPYIIVGSQITGYKDIGRTFFGVKDTLKPIDEYIAEIKQSEAYKSYMAKKS